MRDRCVGTMAEEQQRAAGAAWGPWLHGEGERGRSWSHTFDGTIDPRGDHRAKPESVIRGEWRRFHGRLEKMLGRPVRFAYTIETNEAGRHIHALLADCESLSKRRIDDAWPAGQTEVRRYDVSRGAAYYIAQDLGRSYGSESVEIGAEGLPPLLHSVPSDVLCASDESDEASVLALVGASEPVRRGAHPVPVTQIQRPDEVVDLDAWGRLVLRITIRLAGVAA